MEQPEMDKRTQDLTGHKYGLYIVLSYAGTDKRRKAKWLCQCVCGTQKVVRADNLKGQSPGCGGPVCLKSKSQKYPEPGTRFGKLTAVEFGYTNKNGGGLYWKFRCDCSPEKLTSIRWFQVKNKVIDHCGCDSTRKLVESRYGSTDRSRHPLRVLINQYQKNAQARGLKLELTENQILFLVQQKCFYCGSLPEKITHARKRKFLPSVTPLRHHGIDRWDSSIGYTPHNCVPCCKTCNYAKRDMDGVTFIAWLERASAHVTGLKTEWKKRKRAVEEFLYSPDNYYDALL